MSDAVGSEGGDRLLYAAKVVVDFHQPDTMFTPASYFTTGMPEADKQWTVNVAHAKDAKAKRPAHPDASIEAQLVEGEKAEGLGIDTGRLKRLMKRFGGS